MKVVGGDTDAVILTYSNNNTHYTGGSMNKKLLSKFINADNFYILCRINTIMQDIIDLKNENKSIGQRINYLRQKRIEYIKVITSNKGNKNILREYDKKIDSNVNLVILLAKLQKSNSKLILKYRNKIQQLRKELM